MPRSHINRLKRPTAFVVIVIELEKHKRDEQEGDEKRELEADHQMPGMIWPVTA